MNRMRNIPFGTLFSTLETSDHRLTCGKRSQKKSICLGIEGCWQCMFRWLWRSAGVTHFIQKIACGIWHVVFGFDMSVFSRTLQILQIRVMFQASPSALCKRPAHKPSGYQLPSGRVPEITQVKVNICADLITFQQEHGIWRYRGIGRTSQVLLIMAAMLHWAWWFMKLMIDDYP